jgi:uncharacterized membrane protein YphA (DoxX/SURF4 family)
MRTLGEVIMIAAALACFAVAVAAGYGYLLGDRPLREFFRPVEFGVHPPPYLKFFEEHSAWTVLLPLLLVFGVGWVLHHYG